MDNFYVYVYLNNDTLDKYTYGDYTFDHEPFYIGKGRGRRLKVHLRGSSCNPLFNNKIEKIKRTTGSNPIVLKYKENLTEQEAFDLEINMITTIGRRDLKNGPLCNLTNGGEGLSNPSTEVRQKISSKIKDKFLFYHNRMVGDKNPSKRKDVREKLSIISKNRYMTETHPSLGRKHSNETKTKISIKAKGRCAGIKNPMYGIVGENNPNSKQYNITYPNGSKQKILGLKHWCLKNGLVYSSVLSCVKKGRTYKNYKIERA